MKVDNTPTVTPRSRNLTVAQRLRTEKLKKLQGIGARAKAKKELQNGKGDIKLKPTADNVPKPKKNKLVQPPAATSKFRKRQKDKSWLPTHLYHAKRAHMTTPAEPLWRFAVAITPTAKSYRATHRAGSARGCVAWDMSYISTIGVEGVESSLLGLLRCLGVPDDALTAHMGRKWRNGTRSWSGWVKDRDNPNIWIAEVKILWCAPEHCKEESEDHRKDVKSTTVGNKKRKLLIRVHPSAFLQLWTEILKVAKMQRPQPSVEDLRFEIGSIDMVGPEATEALVGSLQPIDDAEPESQPLESPARMWRLLSKVNNPACVPRNIILGFDVSDPRLRYPPRKTETSESSLPEDDLLQILSSWPPDQQPYSFSFFDRQARSKAVQALSSQKSINRRKGDSLAGQYPSSLPTDPRIPVVLLASSNGGTRGGQGSWTVLLPWKCVKPVWYFLMHFPLSSGGNPRFGGLREVRQLAFERHTPWFPADFPGTKSGLEWEVHEREKRKVEWKKHPKGRRTEWGSVDLGKGRKGEIGKGWACDWEYLFEGPPTVPVSSNTQPTSDTVGPTDQSQSTTAHPFDLCQLPPQSRAGNLIAALASPHPRTLITVRVALIHRGVPTTCARIYRLPANNLTLRNKWIELTKPRAKISRTGPAAIKRMPLASNAAQHEKRAALATALLESPPEASKLFTDIAEDTTQPVVPDEEDLIGYVTTGNFNLGEGHGTGIGSIALSKVKSELESGNRGALCIVREAGMGLGRIARWEML